MEISGLLNLQGEMFLLLAAGAMIRKKVILPPAAKDILTDLILYLVLPCNIIHSFRMEFDLGVIKTVLVLIVAAVMIQLLCMVLIRILYNREETGRKKVGGMLGDFVEVGCGTVVNPGSVIGRNTSVYPLSMVRGYIPADSVYKNQGEIVEKRP